MKRISNQLNYTCKKNTLCGRENKRTSLKSPSGIRGKNQNRVQYLIFIDESGVNLAMVRLYGKALKGQRTEKREHLTFAAKLEIGVGSQEKRGRRKEEEGRSQKKCFYKYEMLPILSYFCFESIQVTLDRFTHH